MQINQTQMQARCLKCLSYLFRTAGALSIFVAGVFREDFVQDHFMWLSRVVGTVVPGVDRIASVAPYPALTATIYSLNWLFVPALFIAMIAYSRFWDDVIVVKFLGWVKQIGYVKYACCLAFMSIAILGDLGIVSAIAYFSMSDYATAMQHNWFAAAHNNPIGIALFYWMIGVYEAASYGYLVAVFSGISLHWLRKMHLIPHRA